VVRITIVAPGPQSEGGIRSVVERILPILEADANVEVHWIASHRSGTPVSKLWCFGTGIIKAIYLFSRSSIVHIHGTVSTSLLRKSLFIWLAKIFRCRVIYHFHSTVVVFNNFFSAKSLTTKFAAATLRQCDVIVVLSDIWKQIVAKAFPGSEIEVIYNPVLDLGKSSSRSAHEVGRILYLAHLIGRKGYRDLITAFEQVARECEGSRLVFCGSGEEEEARAYCKQLGIADSVEFRGWISYEDKVKELSKACVFCLPSYDEGLPMGVLEAMSAGVPVVTTPVGGIPDVLTHKENAMLFEPGHVSKLSDCLVELIKDERLRRRLAARALEDSKRFRPARIANDWITLYRSLDPEEK
jgi:glycosyltransferase involved in cell wall biosynthesis